MPAVSNEAASPRRSPLGQTRRVVFISLATQAVETAALVAAALATDSSAILSQTFAAAADVAVQAFLIIGVYSSGREPDETHPLGYGRERFFWSLYAALAIFVSGFTVAFTEVLQARAHATHVTSFRVGYAVLGVTLVLDAFPFWAALRETQRRANAQERSIWQYLRDTTEPATPTELIGNGIALVGGVLATVALALTQATGSSVPDTVASGAIGISLVAAAVALTQLNRSLLTGRGIPARTLEEMRNVVAAQHGVVDVPDIFAIVVGPSTLTVTGDVTFDDDLVVTDVERIVAAAVSDLRARWPTVRYVYLTPVGGGRKRGGEADSREGTRRGSVSRGFRADSDSPWSP
jgi:cation diffusion facilitator family transporter